MRKKKKFALFKLSIVIGILLGLGLKLYTFIRTEKLVCGIRAATECNTIDFLKDSLIWVIIMIIIVVLVVFSAKYILTYGSDAAKNFKIPKKSRKEAKKEIKKELKKEKAEKKQKKVIKI